MSLDSRSSPEGRCLTCGDLAAVLTVTALRADGVAICETPDAARETQDAARETADTTRETPDGACEAQGAATAAVDGTRERVDVSLIESPRVGDRVLVHAGVALAHLGDRAGR